MNKDTFILKLSTFKRIADTVPVCGNLPLSQWQQRLTRHSVREDKDGPLYAPAIWEPGSTRGNEGIAGLTAVVLDCEKTAPPFAELQPRLEGKSALWHTTHRHISESERYRVILPLARAVSMDEWPLVHRGAVRYLSMDGQIDPSCAEPARAYYGPSCPLDRKEESFSGYLDGDLWNPDELISLVVDEPDPSEFTEDVVQSKKSMGGRPGDDFNDRATWDEILSPHGWRRVSESRGVARWAKPGETGRDHHATTNHADTDLFYCFTPEAPPMPCGKAQSKFAVFALLNHGGDFSEATRELVKQGYGEATQNHSPSIENGSRSKFESLEWPEPLPLPEGLPPVKSLEPEMIPLPLRGWLLDISDRMQIPPDFSSAAAIVALGSIIGRGCGIHPKKHDDWLVVPNLWGAVVGRPSLMKTPAISEAQKHLNRLEAEAREEYQQAASAYEIDKEVTKITKAAINEEIKRAVKKGADIEEARTKLAALQDEAPTRRRYQTQDATTEKNGELLIENPRGFLINRDELIGWFRSLDRDGREGDRSFYLEAWNGNSGFTYDRIGRGTLDVPALCLSVFGAMTPGPLSSYVYQALGGGKGDDGLLQRFQVIVWPDAPASWKNVDRFPDTIEKNRAWQIFKALSGEIPGAIQEDGENIPSLHFSPGGQEIFDTWRYELEPRLRGDHSLPPAMESHLTKYRKLMPSLALIFHLVDVVDGASPGAVSEQSAIMAAAYCEYLESHAARVYGAATMRGMEAAKEIIKHIRRGAISEGNTPKSIYRNQWTRLTTPEEVKDGLEVLAAYDWLAMEKIGTGGRPSEIIRLNPHVKL